MLKHFQHLGLYLESFMLNWYAHIVNFKELHNFTDGAHLQFLILTLSETECAPNIEITDKKNFKKENEQR